MKEPEVQLAQSQQSLAEIAVWYSIALIASAFVVLFVMAALAQVPGLNLELVFVCVLVVWMSAIGGSTWRLVRSDRVRRSTTSLFPLHLLQAVLIVFSIPQLLFSSEQDLELWSGMLLVWESWGVIFTVSFLFLAVLARKPVGLRTWVTSAVMIVLVSFAVYRRL